MTSWCYFGIPLYNNQPARLLDDPPYVALRPPRHYNTESTFKMCIRKVDKKEKGISPSVNIQIKNNSYATIGSKQNIAKICGTLPHWAPNIYSSFAANETVNVHIQTLWNTCICIAGDRWWTFMCIMVGQIPQQLVASPMNLWLLWWPPTGSSIFMVFYVLWCYSCILSFIVCILLGIKFTTTNSKYNTCVFSSTKLQPPSISEQLSW